MNAAGSSNDSAADDPAQASAAAESLTPGELLRRERERRSISLLQAAEELHLDTRFVEAIEANRFDELGVPVYARGHLRKYAALVGLSPQFIIERYEALTHRPEVPTPVPASAIVGISVGLEPRSLRGPLWLAIALLVVALAWWIFGEFSTPSVEDAPTAPAIESVDGQSVAGATASTAEPVAPTASASVSSAPAVPEVRLRLEYSEASWTEVYDAAGKRLMFGLGEAGRVRNISGTPPLRVTLGNASAVTVQVNDSPLVVPRQSGRDSARFSIDAGGAVQTLSAVQTTMSGEVPVE